MRHIIKFAFNEVKQNNKFIIILYSLEMQRNGLSRFIEDGFFNKLT